MDFDSSKRAGAKRTGAKRTSERFVHWKFRGTV
jgi:hypothetical protein